MDSAQIAAQGRGIYTNRTMNLRGIKAVGYDMDYTLVHYHVETWERWAYEVLKARFAALGWPVASLQFDPRAVMRGLVIDTATGNLVKANRFGFVKKALHGTRTLSHDEFREQYARTLVDLAEPRWSFLNTLFSISEGCLYAQLVDLLDQRQLPGVMGYAELYKKVRESLDAAHVEGELKAEVMRHPERYVFKDPETALALLDQKHAGKKLLLITNSEWEYTQSMMTWSFDPHLPGGMTWRQLFDVVIVAARKPDFFTSSAPFFEVATPDGLLRPAAGPFLPGSAYFGGSARQLERQLGLSGDEILYAGDHMFGDVHFTKSVLRWRTALILRELEEELVAMAGFRSTEQRIERLMLEKERLEDRQCQLRLLQQRRREEYGPREGPSAQDVASELQELRSRLTALDDEVAPLAKAASELANPTWGLLTRAGNDKSHLARQMERYADIYTSRVSNFLYATPYAYLRSRRGSMPHDPPEP
jgi:HAD superfamily 5'-nucleotidase-like hydrolase